jgi:hypothetical protein
MPAAEHECLWDLWFELLPRGAWELLERLDEAERAVLIEWWSHVRDPSSVVPPEPVQKALEKLQQRLDEDVS